MSFQTKHGLNGLSYSYDFSFFQPPPKTDGKFLVFSSPGTSVVLAYAQLWEKKKKKKKVQAPCETELDMAPEQCLPL